MRNARRYNERITIGRVPDAGDLDQLHTLGYKTLVDVREEAETFGLMVGKQASRLGLEYIHIPIARDGITLMDLNAFYMAVYQKGTAPIYAFSRFGRKPLAFLLLFDAVAKDRQVISIMTEAQRFGFSLENDLLLRAFIVDFMNSGCLESVAEAIKTFRPDLFAPTE